MPIVGVAVCGMITGPLSSTTHFLHHLLPCRTHTGREGFAGYCFKSLAQFVDEFGPVFHLFVGKLGALCPYGIRRFRVGEAHEAEVDEVCADSFFVVRLSQKQVEHKAKLCGILFHEATVDKPVVLVIKPFVVRQCEMCEHP